MKLFRTKAKGFFFFNVTFAFSLPSLLPHFWFQSISVITALEILISTTLASLVSRRKKIIQMNVQEDPIPAICRENELQQYCHHQINYSLKNTQLAVLLLCSYPEQKISDRDPSSQNLHAQQTIIILTPTNYSAQQLHLTTCSPADDGELNLNSKVCLST